MARRRRYQDVYGKRARREGHLARSVYKLEEIDKRLGLLKPRQRVLDLGAYPGSWSLYAAERVGGAGHVVGVDLQSYRGSLPQHCRMITADIHDLAEHLDADARFDVVLSDAAPATTGHRHLDQMRSFQLFMQALQVALQWLDAGGNFVGKIFQGSDFDEARSAVRQHFDRHRIFRPQATRSESYELFIAGISKKRSE